MCLLISAFHFLMFSSSQVGELKQYSNIGLPVLVMKYGRPRKIPCLTKLQVF